MLRCREISKLVSESMDRDLPLRTRIQVWMHLAMCRMCSGFARHVRLLRRAARETPDRLVTGAADSEARLPQDARERITATLRDVES